MRIGLFIPCYVDSFHPEVGIATLELLEKFGLEVEYPLGQTCCGQPLSNTGYDDAAAKVEALFVRNFSAFDYIVSPSGSCVHHTRNSMSFKGDDVCGEDAVAHVRSRTYELVEFLHDVLDVQEIPWSHFPHKVAIHNNCNALRGLRVASMSERREPPFSKPAALLSKVPGIEIVTLDRPDECCGFGGTFSVFEENVSARMGIDKVRDQVRSGAEYVTSSDGSCLIHQQACAMRHDEAMKYIHIAQILNGARE